MDFRLDQNLTGGYTSSSQQARVLTETWVQKNICCPRCGSPHLSHFPNNQAVADFFCPDCRNEYELKSKQGRIGHKITDGAYHTFMERITDDHSPDFFILTYTAADLSVDNLWVIPKQFFVPEIVEKRRPLSQTARRAGWTGCNILFDQIPEQGRIPIVLNRTLQDQQRVRAQMERASGLQTENLQARGWLLDILSCMNRIPNTTFTLSEMYAFEDWLALRHPDNHNIRPKIRQQLQILRDRGFLEFTGRGVYRKCSL